MIPDPVSAIGLGAGLIGFATTGPGNVNALRHSVADFRDRLDKLLRDWLVCQYDIQAWDGTWSYNEHSDEVYRRVWGANYYPIKAARDAVAKDERDLTTYIAGITNTRRDDPAWRQFLTVNYLHRRGILGRFVFALLSETTLTKRISGLKDNINNLQKLSEFRIRSLAGERPRATINAELAIRMANLRTFGNGLFRTLGRLGGASHWALEVRPPEAEGDAEPWQTQKSVKIGVSFLASSVEPSEWRRVVLRYTLRASQNPANWETRVLNRHARAAENPTVQQKTYAAQQRTHPYRNLFERRFFHEELTYNVWKKDCGNLVLALSNWAILLWESDWITDICPSGIRFVRTGHGNEACHTLSPQQHHMHGQAQLAEQASSHSGQTLRNLGLVLAETICATPLRRDANDHSRYEYLEDMKWNETDEDMILTAVDEKSGKRSIRDVVQFCLNTEDGDYHPHDIASFYEEYLEKVFGPIKTWSAKLQENAPRVSDLPIGAANWPNGAFE